VVQKPNRLLAVLCYLLPIVGPVAIFLFGRRKLFALYHACQAIMLAAMAVLLPVAWLVASLAIAWVPMAGPTLGASAFTIVIVGLLAAVVLGIVGIFNAFGAKMTPLFLVGRRGERLFVRLYPAPVVESKQ
jgi:uncharacterized membrane protein